MISIIISIISIIFALLALLALLAGFLWYWCYYPHQLRNALSPTSRIFLKGLLKGFKIFTLTIEIFSESAFSIQSISCSVCVWMCGCVVPSVGNQSHKSWRILVEECIDYIAKLRTTFFVGPKRGWPTGGFSIFVRPYVCPYVSIWFSCVLFSQYTSNPKYFYIFRTAFKITKY